ncbi:hypothetical protein CMV_022449 [Castanea mollissima]|uniref:Uncharacterized protein n=1 Tax=Castanea mollissima TaxID=60419 RepID=A0A8J4QM77_9ROSI|nr:hypothetical protein CMV_022449 [Castanea mollissima]
MELWARHFRDSKLDVNYSIGNDNDSDKSRDPFPRAQPHNSVFAVEIAWNWSIFVALCTGSEGFKVEHSYVGMI